jgi:site-specific recombinase XerD
MPIRREIKVSTGACSGTPLLARAGDRFITSYDNRHARRQGRPKYLTYATIADDLAAFRRYLDDEQVDWLDFSSHKLRRPTYRYNAFLKLAVEAAEISPSVAKRRIGIIVRFYRWLMIEAPPCVPESVT